MTGENIMSYIYVSDLLRYGRLKFAVKFIEHFFTLSKNRIVRISTGNGRVDRPIDSDKMRHSFFKPPWFEFEISYKSLEYTVGKLMFLSIRRCI